MQSLEITTSPKVVCITVERSALNTAMLSRITDILQEYMANDHIPQTLTAAALRRLPLHERDAVLAAQTELALHDFEYLHGGEELTESEET